MLCTCGGPNSSLHGDEDIDDEQAVQEISEDQEKSALHATDVAHSGIEVSEGSLREDTTQNESLPYKKTLTCYGT